jgi:lysophospholipase
MAALAHLIDDPGNPIPAGAEVGVVTAADGRALRWARFAPMAAQTRGTVLILQGRAEFVERWFETVRDLQVRGFHVVAFDWRGQGGSERLAADPHKGHVADFRAYDFDLDVVLREIVAPLPGPLHLLAHSTGGLVAVANAARLEGIVRRVVLTAPFFGLGSHGVPRRLVRPLALVLRGLGLGGAYVPGGDRTPILTTRFAGERLTSDPVRLARGADLSRRHPEIAIGSPTIAWLDAALAAQRRVFDPDRLEAWRLPTLVFAAGAEAVVDNDAIERFVVATRTSDLITIPGALHELLQERDRYREQVWAAFDAFVPGSDAPAPTPAPVVASRTGGEPGEDGLVQPRIAGGDDAPAVGGAAAGPRGDDAARPLDHRDQGDDVVGLQPGLDHDVGEAGRDHAVGVAVDPVARQPHL